MLDLGFLSSVDRHLLGNVVRAAVLFGVGALHLVLEGLLLLLVLSELDLNVSETLLELLDLSLSDAELLDDLSSADGVSRLHDANFFWELGLDLCSCYFHLQISNLN